MMLDHEFEVRIRLDGSADENGNCQPAAGTPYVTDLDIQTLRRAEGIFSATEAERGPWVPDNVYEGASREEVPTW